MMFGLAVLRGHVSMLAKGRRLNLFLANELL